MQEKAIPFGSMYLDLSTINGLSPFGSAFTSNDFT